MNWTGSIARFFVEKGKLTALLVVALFVWGILSYFQTTKKYNPTIVAPAFQIQVEYPGASRKEVLEEVTKPFERIISDIAGVEDVYSVTYKGGMAIINVNFFVGEDPDKANISLNERIQSDIKTAPLGIQPPTVTAIDPEDVPIITIALSSDTYSPIELRKFAYQLRDKFSLIEGTSRIAVIGGQRRELAIIVDPAKLSQYAITLDQIEQSLKMNNLYLPTGHIKADKTYYPIETDANLKSPAEIEEIVVVSNYTIDIKLKDVAEIKQQAEEQLEYISHSYNKRVNSKNTVLISISKLNGSNIEGVGEGVTKKLDFLNANFIPKDIDASIVVNEANTAKDEVNGLLKNLFTSIGIVIAILFVFLNFKAALLVAIAIPLTLSSVFGVALIADQSINRITLFALILSLGLLVDNATVVIENIIRKTNETKKITKMTFIEAVSEVGPGLFMSTVTTVLAFIPMAFISGMMGPYMGPIPFFVPGALIISLIISFTINPWMASVLIKSKPEKEEAEKKLSKLQQHGMHFLMLYRNVLRSILSCPKKRSITLITTVIILIISSSLPFVYLVKFRLLPKANVNQYFIYADLPAGSSLEKTNEVSKYIESIVKKNVNTTMVQSYVGTPPVLDFNGLFKGVSGRMNFNQATIRVGLIDDDFRDIKSETIVENMRPIINSNLKSQYPGLDIKIKLIEDPPGPPVLSTFLLRVQGTNEDDIVTEAKNLEKVVNNIKGVTDIDTTIPIESETVQIVIDHFATSKAKVAPAQVIKTLRSLYNGQVLGIYHNEDNIEQEVIRIKLKRGDRINHEVLDQLTIPNPMRIAIPISRLVKIKKTKTQAPLRRENLKNTVYITGEMEKRSITYAGIDMITHLYDYVLESDKKSKKISFDLFGTELMKVDGEKISISIGGEWELTLDVFRDLMIAMSVAILAIYLVLVAQFESFSEPFIIMSSIPLGVIGVMPGFMILNFINGEYFTATSMIGVIALAGIAVNNSIILLEYINSLKKTDIGLIEALVEACSTRLRPIALTTITTMLGSMTILDDPVWSGLAWAIILGLGMSSALILIIFPTIYYIVRGKDWHLHRVDSVERCDV